MSRVLSLTLRLFGTSSASTSWCDLASIVPFIAPLPIQFLGLIVGPLQLHLLILAPST